MADDAITPVGDFARYLFVLAFFAQRLINQMYFQGDPLIPLCPIVRSIPDPRAVDLLVAALDLNAAVPLDSLAYRFDIVLRGTRATPFENRP